MIKKIKKVFLNLIFLPMAFFLSGCALSNFWDDKAPETLTRSDITLVLNKVIDWLLGAAGFTAIIFIIVGAYQYITSLGNEEQVKKAKSTLTWAFIGLILILGAYGIIHFIYSTLLGPNVQNVMP